MSLSKPAAFLIAVLLFGCSRQNDDVEDGGTPPDDEIGSTKGQEFNTTPKIYDKVYAHSASTLYEVDPNDLILTTVGDFIWPPEMVDESMTDIALDDDGNMIGISFLNVYAVDKTTAECTFLTPLSGGFNGLSFVASTDDAGDTRLVGATTSGEWFTLDPSTGESTLLGNLGNDMTSSGDIVFARDAGAFATVNHPDYVTDVLVTVTPETGEATIIGETGYDAVWGIGYWGGQIFGFTKSGQFILIDAATGVGELVETLDANFWGAGVTTLAPVVV